MPIGPSQREGAGEKGAAVENVVFGCVLINDVPENQRIEQRKDLVDRGEQQGEGNDAAMRLQVRPQNVQGAAILCCEHSATRARSAGRI